LTPALLHPRQGLRRPAQGRTRDHLCGRTDILLLRHELSPRRVGFVFVVGVIYSCRSRSNISSHISTCRSCRCLISTCDTSELRFPARFTCFATGILLNLPPSRYMWIGLNTIAYAITIHIEKWAATSTDQTHTGISCYQVGWGGGAASRVMKDHSLGEP
jgi:hypothetical protein